MITNIWDKPYEDKEVTETAEAFEIFIIYRDMENRSLKKLQKQTKIKYSTLAYWSKTYKWSYRIKQMIEYNATIVSKEKVNIQKEAVNLINERVLLKHELIYQLYLSFKREFYKTGNTRKDLKELIVMFKNLESIEAAAIENNINLNKLENILNDDAVDVSDLRVIISNYNPVLTDVNKVAIDDYAGELENEKY